MSNEQPEVRHSYGESPTPIDLPVQPRALSCVNPMRDSEDSRSSHDESTSGDDAQDGEQDEMMEDFDVNIIRNGDEHSATVQNSIDQRERHPYITGGFLSRAFFIFASKLVSTSHKYQKHGKELQDEDVWPVMPHYESVRVGKELHDHFTKELAAGGGSGDNDPRAARAALQKSLFTIGWRDTIIGGLVALLNLGSKLAIPLLMSEVLKAAEKVTTSFDSAFFLALGLALALGISSGLTTVSQRLQLYIGATVGFRWRAGLTSLVFRKALNLNEMALQSTSTGTIINLLNQDIGALRMFIMGLHLMWVPLLEILGYIAILYLYVGFSIFAGLGVLLLTIPLSSRMTKLLRKYTRSALEFSDKRVKSINEALLGIQGVKMGAWEDEITENVASIRSNELDFMFKATFTQALLGGIMEIAPALASTAAIAIYASREDVVISGALLFPTVASFEKLKAALGNIPMAINVITAYRVSLNRFAEFLAQKDQCETLSDSEIPDDVFRSRGLAVEIVDGEFGWSKRLTANKDNASSDKVSKKNKKGAAASVDSSAAATSTSSSVDQSISCLIDINLKFARGELSVIVGSVGSGKTALCSTVLRNLDKRNGRVTVDGNVALVTQTAWLLNATLRDNILFGLPYDEHRYNNVLRACQLEPDLALLPAGDMTMIGEKGINLSGGQKQRVSIARAAYSTNPIVILDDPLSALDPGVASRVFRECVCKLMAGRTRIMVTNQLQFLKHSDSVVVLADARATEASAHVPGRVALQGTFEQVMNSSDPNVTSLLDSLRTASSSSPEEEATAAARESETGKNDKEINAELLKSTSASKKSADKLMKAEDRQEGAVRYSDLLSYVQQSGSLELLLLSLIAACIAQSVQILSNVWLTFWSSGDKAGYQGPLEPFQTLGINITEGITNASAGSTALQNAGNNAYLIGYVVIGISIALLMPIPIVSLQLVAIRSAKKIHQKLIQRVLHAPMSFFDTTPVGRILSRFSADTRHADRGLSSSMWRVLIPMVALFGAVITVSILTPLVLTLVLPVPLLYSYYVRLYRPVNRSMDRMVAISRSPVASHLSEVIGGGLSTIRAYGVEDSFLEENSKRVDGMVKQYFAAEAVDSWFGQRLALIGSFVTCLACVFAVVSVNRGWIGDNSIGLSVTYALSIADLLRHVVNGVMDLETSTISVERLLFYANQIEQEAPYHQGPGNGKSSAPKGWPSRGEIQVTDLKMRYRAGTPLVLKGVTFKVLPGERVGVVGRTGSGKSSLMLCLLRLVEPEYPPAGPGPILVDGVDICKLGLADVRSKISIVPQNPVVLSTSIRRNLDPLNRFQGKGEIHLWNALEQCRLKDFVTKADGKLDYHIQDQGGNLSQGQRQLLTLARALLSGGRILFLDEATSSVDAETDAVIQQTLRTSEAFKGCTVITIAHRLDTVMDSDKILVMNNGQVAEYDSPQRLSENSESMLSAMLRAD